VLKATVEPALSNEMEALYSDPHFSIPKGDLDLDWNYTIDDSKKEWAS
jgi:hypothetical protein